MLRLSDSKLKFESSTNIKRRMREMEKFNFVVSSLMANSSEIDKNSLVIRNKAISVISHSIPFYDVSVKKIPEAFCCCVDMKIDGNPAQVHGAQKPVQQSREGFILFN